MPAIHVHVHDKPKPKAALLRAPDCGCKPVRTRDSDDGEGKWVTINGAAVHIGKGGKIDKGPKELMEKSENGAHEHHHSQKAKEHSDTAEAKGKNHADYNAHRNASKAHSEAAFRFGQADYHAGEGRMNSARNEHAVAQRKAAEADKHTEATKAKGDDKPYSKSTETEGFHNDAADEAKGSEKHEAEHKRLMSQYDKSKSTWERNAINQQVTKNAGEAMKSKTQAAHHKALASSEHAKTTGAIEHHQAARKAIDEAHELHQRTGGEGVKAKLADLEKMRKPHHAAVQAHEKEQAKKNKSAAKTDPMTMSHGEAYQHHTAEAEKAKAAGKHDEATAHTNVATMHLHADKDGQGSRSSEQAYGASRTLHEQTNKKDAPPKLTPRQALLREQGSPRYVGRKAGSSTLEKIAAKHLKKAAEDMADQDPKHKK